MHKLIKMLMILWDPDFTKVTIRERIMMAVSERQYKKGIFYTEDDIYDS